MTGAQPSRLLPKVVLALPDCQAGRLRCSRLRATLRPARGEALTTQNWPALLRLERHTVRLAALIANDFKTFALAAAALSLTTEILSPRISTRLAALRMCQPALAIVILLSFGKRKGRAAFGTRNI